MMHVKVTSELSDYRDGASVENCRVLSEVKLNLFIVDTFYVLLLIFCGGSIGDGKLAKVW